MKSETITAADVSLVSHTNLENVPDQILVSYM